VAFAVLAELAALPLILIVRRHPACAADSDYAHHEETDAS
jgi:hypothetical protein